MNLELLEVIAFILLAVYIVIQFRKKKAPNMPEELQTPPEIKVIKENHPTPDDSIPNFDELLKEITLKPTIDVPKKDDDLGLLGNRRNVYEGKLDDEDVEEEHEDVFHEFRKKIKIMDEITQKDSGKSKVQRVEVEAHPFAKKLQTSQGIKEAFIMSEIFQRKF